MSEPKIVGERDESEDEQRVRAWFTAQALASPETLDAAARTLIGLVTGLVGVLFGVLTIAGEPGKQPAYLALEAVRWLGVIAVAALLVALLSGLNVVLPRKLWIYANRPREQRQALADILTAKSRWLRIATGAFATGLVALTVVLVIALLHR